MLLILNTDSDNQSILKKWPQDVAPLVTLEEVYGEDVIHLKKTYACGAAEEYYYRERGSQYYISYKLLISPWDEARRAFERNPNISYYYFWPGIIDRKEHWQSHMSELDPQQLCLKNAWQVTYPDQRSEYCPYKYYLETDDAALFLEAEQEIPMEWIREIAVRLQEIK